MILFGSTGALCADDAVPEDDAVPKIDRAAALIEARAFDQATIALEAVLARKPSDRRARELLAFVFESTGAIDRERQVRAALAADYPSDAQIQAALGRVLERAGDERGALTTYRRARGLAGSARAADIDAAIERMDGQTSTEVGGGLGALSDPDADALRTVAGTALPIANRLHLALAVTHYLVSGTTRPGSAQAVALAPTLVLRRSGSSLAVGPRFAAGIPGGGAPGFSLGAAISGSATLHPHIIAELRGDLTTLWDDAALTVLHDGLQTGASGRLYVHAWQRRLVVQAGVGARRLSLLAQAPGDQMTRSDARQSLGIAGADLVAWRRPGTTLRGQILDDAFVAPAVLPSAITLSYRHYEAFSQPSAMFSQAIALAERATVDELSSTASIVPHPTIGVEARAGAGRDSVRDAWMWRVGASLLWAPTSALRFALRYDTATEVTTGFAGRRQEGWISCHADL